MTCLERGREKRGNMDHLGVGCIVYVGYSESHTDTIAVLIRGEDLTNVLQLQKILEKSPFLMFCLNLVPELSLMFVCL